MSVTWVSLEKSLKRMSDVASYWMHRFIAQARFIEELTGLHPDAAEEWKRLLDKAGEPVEAAARSGSPCAMEKAVKEAEAILAPISKTAKEYNILCAGHGHIDMNWQWSWPETVACVNDMFTTMLKLMDEYPTFCFSQSQASVYEIVEKHNPELLDRIREHVREGRWEVTASHWVETEKNIAGAEPLCRHILYTRRYMRELFGLEPEDIAIDWAPDTFGHAITVPSYLARGGVKYYFCCRPGRMTRRPPAFWWEAPDGSRVLVNQRYEFYNCRIEPKTVSDMLNFSKQTGMKTWVNVYGVGDHGGGPTRRDIRRGLDMDSWPIYPNFKFSPVKAFFAELEKIGDSLPVIKEELNFEFTGCYTSQSLIKRINRLAENQLAQAETATALVSSAFGGEYPFGNLLEAWRNTLFSHFHDILPGSGVHDTRTYAHGRFQDTAAATGIIETESLRALAARVDTSSACESCDEDAPPPHLDYAALGAGVGYGSGAGEISGAEQSAGSGPRPFLVFNPCDSERNETVIATVWDNDPVREQNVRAAKYSVKTPSGELIPAQTLGGGRYWGHHYANLAFPVESVPAFGYSLYTVIEGEMAIAEPPVVTEGQYVMENEHIRVEIDPATCGIASLIDKKSGAELIDPKRPSAVLEYAVERPRGMSSWELAPTGPVCMPEIKSASLTQRGPNLAAFETKSRINDSEFTRTIELRAGERGVRIKLEGTWVERGSREKGAPVIRMAFPMALDSASGRYEIPFGAIDRSFNSGEEVPALRWAQISGELESGEKAGCLLLNDCKHGHSLDGNVLRLNLIRSSYEPDPLPEIGKHVMSMTLVPFTGEMPVERAVRLGMDHNHQLRMMGTDIHQGDLPATGGFLSVEPENVVLTSIKKSEENDGLILRLVEYAGKATKTTVIVGSKLSGTPAEAVEVDLIERPLKTSSAKLDGDVVSVDIPAYGIVSVLVKTGKSVG